jgi:hypothetical protein
MKRTLVIAVLVLAILGILMCVPKIPPNRVQAQFTGYVSLQTVRTSFSMTMSPSPTVFTGIQNLGQSSHLIQYQFVSTPVHGCSFLFDGSNNNVNWNTLASGNDTEGLVNGNAISTANGYFQYLRIKANPNSLAACSGEVLSGTYTGYQVPLPISQQYFMGRSYNVSNPVKLTPLSFPNPWVLGGFHVENTASGAVNAFVQFFDSTAATLGTNVILEVNVAAGSNYTYTGPAMVGLSGISVGAATALDGSTAAGTAVYVEATFNQQGPFYPLFPVSP